MLNLNRHEIIGHLGADPVLRYTASGRPVANLSIATTAAWKDQAGERQERTEWHRIVVWGKRAEWVAENTRRGNYVRVVGSSQTRSWTDREGTKRFATEVVAQSVDPLYARAAGERQPPASPEAPVDNAPVDDQTEAPPAASDEEVPF
jgi:single-strand DNA-binding protein